jgi:hypothetical protein
LERDLGWAKRGAIRDAEFIGTLQSKLADTRDALEQAGQRAANTRRLSSEAMKPSVSTKDADNQTDSAMWKRFTLLSVTMEITKQAKEEAAQALAKPPTLEIATQTEEAVATKEEEETKPKKGAKKKRKQKGSSAMNKYQPSKTPKTPDQALSLIYDMWEKKLISDEVDDGKGIRRENMGRFMFEYLVGTYGLKKLADKNARDIVASITANEKKEEPHPRIQIFGVMVGVLKPELYCPKLADMILQILGRLIPLWKGIATFLFARKCGELLFSKIKIRSAMLGGNGRGERVKGKQKKSDPSPTAASDSDAPTVASNSDGQCACGHLLTNTKFCPECGTALLAKVGLQRKVTKENKKSKVTAETCKKSADCCVLVGLLEDLDQMDELDRMMDKIDLPVEEGGCYRAESKLRNADGEIVCIDFDLVLGVILDTFTKILLAERMALAEVAKEHDMNQDEGIELKEFVIFTSAIMPDHFTERQEVKLFTNMCQLFISDATDDDKVTYNELSLYCVSHGLYVSPGWKKIAKDYVVCNDVHCYSLK